MKTLFNAIFANFHIKVLALLAAAGIWVYAVNTDSQVGALEETIPVETFNLSDGLALVGEIEEIQLEIRAPQQIFNTLTAADFTAFVDLEGLDAGTYTLEPTIISEQSDIQIFGQTPKSITITLEEEVTEVFQISTELANELPNEVEATGDATTSQESVEVTGAESLVNSIDRIVARLDLASITASEDTEIQEIVNLEALDAEGKIVEQLALSPSTVEVLLELERTNDTKTVSIQPELIGTPTPGFTVDQVTVSPQTITIVGNSSTLDEIESIRTEAVSVSGENTIITRTANLILPEGVEIQEGETATITITFSSSIVERTFNAEILFINTPEGLTPTSAPKTVSVTLSGIATNINATSDSDIKFEVDLTGKSEGETTLALSGNQVSAPSSLDVVSIGNGNITVTLSAN